MSPTGPSGEELLGIALEAAGAAVALIRDERPADLQVATKSSATDLVTGMDRASQQLIRSVVHGARPDDRFVGEEDDAGPEPDALIGRSAHRRTSSEDAPGLDRPSSVGTGTDVDANDVTWWVDPIDGTTNYVYDHPGYAVSIAASVAGRTVAAVVADPTHGRTYRACAGGGAHCTDTIGPDRERQLRIGDPPPLDRALVATGFAYDPERRRDQGRVVAGLLPRVRDIRRMGAAALDLCSVASGRVDVYFEAGLSVWDFAAGALIAEESGARVGDLSGGAVRAGSVLAAHPDLFPEVVDLLAVLGATPAGGD